MQNKSSDDADRDTRAIYYDFGESHDGRTVENNQRRALRLQRVA